MRNIWAWVAGVVVGVFIIGLLVAGQPGDHHHRAAYVVIRGTTEQQAQTKVPPGHWLVIRRISAPVGPMLAGMTDHAGEADDAEACEYGGRPVGLCAILELCWQFAAAYRNRAVQAES